MQNPDERLTFEVACSKAAEGCGIAGLRRARRIRRGHRQHGDVQQAAAVPGHPRLRLHVEARLLPRGLAPEPGVAPHMRPAQVEG